VYFNGKESLLAGVEKIDNSVKDDYSKILPIYKSSLPSTSTVAVTEMDNAILKGSKLIQSHSITKKPKRRKNRSDRYIEFASKEEFNNWIDDSYILMGQSHFYKHSYFSAIENFNYVIRKFPDESSVYIAYIWLIRCYTEMERYVEAYEIIQQLQDDDDFPQKLEGELAVVTSDYYARQLDYKEGIPFLSIATKESDKKDHRLRYTYILAQWYEETGNLEKASETFREISRMNPPYEMAFNARISAADNFTGTGDVEKLKKELRKMLRDRKNIDYRDQIYFALGNISIREGNKENAISEYTKSASFSSKNLYQRALSCLTLAQIYFDDLSYKKAQSYYDSAMVVIDDNYPDYQKIAERHTSLTNLTDNLYTIEREDSLQRIALMDEPSRNVLIDKWIAEATKKEEQSKMAEQAQMMDQNYFRQNESRFGLSQQQEGAGWYFYSPTTVAYGKVEFERLWGKRQLQDNWRRSDQRIESEGIEGNPENVINDLTTGSNGNSEANTGKKVSDVKTRDYYLQNLPLNDTLMNISHNKIRDALFNAGRIFKTEFSDYNRSVESFEDLNNRYPNNIYLLSAYFELWNLYSERGDVVKAAYYKDLIIGTYPETKYAKYLLNPNYFIELEAKADSVNRLYQKAFFDFKNGKYADAASLINEIKPLNPDTLLIPKMKFIESVAQGTQVSWESFGNILNDYIKTYPKAEPVPLAEQILRLINDSTLVDYQKLVDSGYLNDQIQNSELLSSNAKDADEFQSKFSYDEELLHYFVLAYPKNAGFDLNRLKFDIANYNIDHYTKYDFDIETQDINSNTSLLVIRSFLDKQQGLIYFRSIIKKREVFAALKEIKYVNFIASSTNFRVIIADKDYNEYLKFYIKNYSKFISGDFTDELLPEPEDLLAKALAEENQLKEKGTFVKVSTTASGNDFYEDEDGASQNFIVAVNAPKFNMKPVNLAFAEHNSEQYKDAGLKIELKQVDTYQLLVVKSFKDKTEGLNFFTQAVSNRKLYRSLDTLSYRNFIITDNNLKKLIESKRMTDYLNFFRNKYMGSEPTGAGQTQIQVYQGPYKQNVQDKQSFALIVPKDEINIESLTETIKQFNIQNYREQNLKISTSMLDDFRLFIKVEGLTSKQEALSYLRAIAGDQLVYGPLQNVNYRNFVITPANEDIFKKDKNILTYMEFYKLFYLNTK
jgi:tetratricopeptide (TPR) repeat protein